MKEEERKILLGDSVKRIGGGKPAETPRGRKRQSKQERERS